MDAIELAVYGERKTIGGAVVVSDGLGNFHSLEAIEDKLRSMIPGANLYKRLLEKPKINKSPEPTVLALESIEVEIPAESPRTLITQPGTYMRPLLTNPLACGE